jgi:hypothetical protein
LSRRRSPCASVHDSSRLISMMRGPISAQCSPRNRCDWGIARHGSHESEPGPEPTLEPAAPSHERRRHHTPEHQAPSSLGNKEEFDMCVLTRDPHAVLYCDRKRGTAVMCARSTSRLDPVAPTGASSIHTVTRSVRCSGRMCAGRANGFAQRPVSRGMRRALVMLAVVGQIPRRLCAPSRLRCEARSPKLGSE